MKTWLQNKQETGLQVMFLVQMLPKHEEVRKIPAGPGPALRQGEGVQTQVCQVERQMGKT